MTPIKALFIIGTRPEGIKLAPVIRQFERRPEIAARVCVTAQHREMLDQVLELFGITVHHDLDVMRPGQTLAQSAARILRALEAVLERERPDVVLVQGDTTTTFCGALAAFYQGIPVAHIEAGLRTGDLRAPFPEELHRVLASRMAALHFAATPWAATNLRTEGVQEERVFITGNTGVDAVLFIRDQLEQGCVRPSSTPQNAERKRILLVTAHRRESFGDGFERIASALLRIAARGDVHIVYPLHPNPQVRQVMVQRLSGQAAIELMEPLDYCSFVDLMRRAYLLITDSGGVQEEGPSLGKPILVLREKTERPEAVAAGTVRLVGTDEERIVEETTRLLEDAALYGRMARAHNPYGDGHASERICNATLEFFNRCR